MKLVKLIMGVVLLLSVVIFVVVDGYGIELYFIMCGGEVCEVDQKVVDVFVVVNDGVIVNLEVVFWGICQDKLLILVVVGDLFLIVYMGLWILCQLVNNDLIVFVEIFVDWEDMYQFGILNIVIIEGMCWGYLYVFLIKVLYINCDFVEVVGMICEVLVIWDDMYVMVEVIKNNIDVVGIGFVGKDFDNIMYQFLNYLYLNGGVVIDLIIGENMLDSD